jgi:hypothetical protein
MGSKRTYTVKEIKRLNRAEAALETTIGAGGSTLLETEEHALEGAAHTSKSGALLVRNVISPAQLTANTDNWSPTDLATADVIRASTDASRNLTGIAAPATGYQALVLANVGAFDLVLKHDATSTAANRLLCPNDADMTLQKDSTAVLVYDLASTRWRVIGGGGGGGATALIVQEGDTTVEATASTLDFGHGLDVTSSPAGEANIAVDESELDHGTLGGLGDNDHPQYALAADQTGSIEIVLDGAGLVLTVGIKLDIEIPFDLTFTGWTLLANLSGAIKIDLWKDTYTNFPPDNADSITNAHEPEITASGTKAQDLAITDWSGESCTAGDIIRVNIDSVATITRATLSLQFTRD